MVAIRRWLHLVLIVAIVALHLPISAAYAQADERPKQILSHLQGFASRLSTLVVSNELRRPLPLTNISPADAAGLSLTTIFTKTLQPLQEPGSLPALAQALQSAGGPDVNGVAVSLTNVSVTESQSNPALIDVNFTFNATRSVDLPLRVAESPLVLNSGSYRADLSLFAPFHLQFDTHTSPPTLNVLGEPTLTITARSAGEVNLARGLVGFAEVIATGTIALSADITVTLGDPDRNGLISQNEWFYTAPEDLFRVAYLDQPGDDVNAAVTLTAAPAGSTAIAGIPNGALTLVDPNLADGLLQPATSFGPLADFGNVTPSQMLSGLQAFTSALGTAHLVGDQRLPFANTRLLSTTALLDPLVTFIRRHGDAAILCGAQDKVPPVGDPSNLPQDSTIYCQAIALKQPSDVRWHTAQSNEVLNSDLQTVGPNPSKVAALKMPVGGIGDIFVTFVDETGEHTVRPLFRSAQELYERLSTLSGFNASESAMAFHPDTSALTYRLVLSPPLPSRSFKLDFGDVLTASTGIANMRQSGSVGSEIGVDNLHIDVTFGVILEPQAPDVGVDGRNDDRFFLQVRPDEYEIRANVSMTGQIELNGQIGFMGIKAKVGEPPLTLQASNPAKPMLALDITTPAGGIARPGRTPITNAITLSELLAQPTTYVQPAHNLVLRGGLRVEALINGQVLGAGNISIEWFSDPNQPPTVTASPDFDQQLKIFYNLDPDDPQALKAIVLDSLQTLLEGLSSVGGDTINTSLPLIGRSPKQLLDFEALESSIASLRREPVGTLQELATRLNTSIGNDILGFELKFPPAPALTELVIVLAYNRQAPLPIQFNLALNGAPALIANQEQTPSQSTYRVNTSIRISVPLIPIDQLPNQQDYLSRIRIAANSNASVEVQLEEEHIAVSVGSRSLRLAADGKLRFGARVSLSDPTATTDEPRTLSDFIDTLELRFGSINGFAAESCGVVQPSGVDLTGDVCAKLALNLEVDGVPGIGLGELGFRIEDITTVSNPDTDLTTPAGWYFVAPQLDAILTDPTQALNWDQLAGSLPELLRALETALKAGKPIPMIGDDLQAGVNAVKEIRERVVAPLNDLNTQLSQLGTTELIAQAIKDRLLSPPSVAIAAGVAPAALSSLVKDQNNDGDVNNDDITVEFLPPNVPPSQLNEVRVSLILGDNPIDTKVPFDLGIDGVPFELGGGLQSDVGWSLPLTFGMSRDAGPYIGLNGSNDPALAFSLGSHIGLAPNTGLALPAPLPPELQGYTDQRTVTATLGFLYVKWFDNIANPTQLGLDVTLTSATATGQVPVERISTVVSSLTPAITTTAHLDLLFHAALEDSTNGQLPAILGTITIPNFTHPETIQAESIFQNIHVDVGGFVEDFVNPVFDTVGQVTRPIQPVVDALYAPIPGISDLSRMTTGEDISLISLVKTNVDTTLITRLAQVASISTKLEACFNGGIIPLPPECDLALRSAAAQSQSASIFLPAEAFAGQDAGAVIMSQLTQSQLVDAATASDVRTQAFRLPEGLSLPFLESPESIVGLLLGKDIVLMRFDAGTLRGEGGINYTFPPIMVGPIPISIGVSATVAVEGRFAMGYDTVGLRQAVNSGSGVSLLNGLFIDDRDTNGVDVPEIALIGTAAVSAAIDAVIVAAGIKGGIELTLGLNLHDNEPQDGRLHFDEIGSRLNNPICLFDATGKLAAFLSAFVRIGFSFLSKTFEFRIAKVTLVDFSVDLCANPQEPNLADPDNGNVILNMGPRAGNRNLPNGSADTDEEFIVRQISPENAYPPGVGGGTRISISAFGIYEEETVESNGKIIANGGNGNDTISLEPGADIQTKQPITFTLTADLSGGPGDDDLKGATGNDTLHGDAGNDTLSGDAGSDTIYGGDDDDVIDGGLDADTQLFGEAGNDVITGGPHGDTLDGGPGNDRLTGGPGTNLLADPNTGRAATPGVSPDLDDTMIGGWGDDALDGGFGNDTLYGNEVLQGTREERCAVDGAPSGDQTDDDILMGGLDDDVLFGGIGDDRIVGQDGKDYGCGNAGNDTIEGDGEGTISAPGDDELHGGPGMDVLHGQNGNDNIFGDAEDDQLFGEDGDDNLSGGRQTDRLSGGLGRDYLFGDDGYVEHDASQPGGKRAVFFEELGDPDFIHGDEDDDVIYGEGGGDQLWGDAGQDLMHGNAGDDIIRGGLDDDLMYGDANDDTMDGDSGLDDMYGNTGNDIMRGGIGDDYIEGNQDTDTTYGDADQDDIIGGSKTPQTPDARDILFGNAGQDVMAGDNAIITRPGGIDPVDGSVRRDVTLLDIDSLDQTLSGPDDMNGGGENDRMWGQAQNDLMRGGTGDDMMEGNADTDTMYGDADQDDIVGGSQTPGRRDSGDRIWGGAGEGEVGNDFDVIVGDNALIERRVIFDSWDINEFNGSVVRRVTLYDEAIFGQALPGSGLSGNDRLFGEGSDDMLYGQGGNDIIDGGSGNDYVEGGNSNDTIDGGPGQDDLIGGTAAEGRFDGIDTLRGGADDDLTSDVDVLLGDNGVISRPLACGLWQTNVFNNSTVRTVTLFEIAAIGGTTTLGDRDTLFGGGGDDLLYGQGGNDALDGGIGDDYIEGNANNDQIIGGEGNDDLIGGTSRVGNDAPTGVAGRRDGPDTISGGAGFDTIAGDNAILARTLINQPPAFPCQRLIGGQWKRNTFNGGITHQTPVLLDRDSAAVEGLSGDDRIDGDADDDTIYGQGGYDILMGGLGDDTIEGNAGGDAIGGGAGHDDLIGGSSVAGVFDDVPDTLRGGDGADVLLGDNGTIGRPLSNGRWRIDTNTTGVVREVRLFDQQRAEDAVNPRLGSGDSLSGENDADRIYGQSGDDIIYGGAGDDSIEGNQGNDIVYGDDGEDDVIGGSSASDGVIGGSKTPRNLADGDDNLHGGGDDDVVLGDNGRIRRPIGDNGQWTRLIGSGFDVTVREVSMESDPEREAAYGNDRLYGEEGHDDLYGQLGDDTLEGGTGEDTLLGDLGRITPNLLGDGRNDPGSLDRTITTNAPTTRMQINRRGVLRREVSLFAQGSTDGGGSDILLGGNGADSLHGGHGNDLLQGNADNDRLFGSDGNDALWGGGGDDRLWGGYGNDYLDVKPRSDDSASWHSIGGTENFDGADILYGGWDQDALQGNQPDVGSVQGDRLLDWEGTYNVYFQCTASGTIGQTTTRSSQTVTFLRDLARDDGLLALDDGDSAGTREAAIVASSSGSGDNRSPRHPDPATHFVCN